MPSNGATVPLNLITFQRDSAEHVRFVDSVPPQPERFVQHCEVEREWFKLPRNLQLDHLEKKGKAKRGEVMISPIPEKLIAAVPNNAPTEIDRAVK